MRVLAMALSLVATLILLTMACVQGGVNYDVVCDNKNCTFKDSLHFGGGMTFDDAVGYCLRCEKFVRITFRGPKRNGPGSTSMMKELMNIWVPETGKTQLAFFCPKCSNPVIDIESEKNMKFCPKCGQPTLKSQATGLDD